VDVHGVDQRACTIAELANQPIRTLWRRFSREMRHQRQALRRAQPDNYVVHFGTYRDAWALWLSHWWPARTGRIWPSLYALDSYVRVLDDGVDVPGQSDERQLRSLDRVQAVLDALAGKPSAAAMSMVATDKDAVFMWIARSAAMRGIDITPDIIEAFRAFKVDARRIIEHRPVPTEDEFLQLLHGDLRLGVVYCLLAGLDEALAWDKSAILLLFVFWADTLFDLADDVRDNRLSIPESACVGFTTTQLLACQSWDELGQVPGFRPWYNAQVAFWLDFWFETVQPTIDEAIAAVPSAWRRRSATRLLRYHSENIVAELRRCKSRYPQLRGNYPELASSSRRRMRALIASLRLI
jgi:hypothetical protein